MTTVDELMASQVLVASPTDTLGEARGRMLEHDVHALPVVDESGRAVGILTSGDLIEDHDPETPVAEVMTPNVYSVPVGTTAAVAARMMRNRRLHHLVVCDGERLAGIVSTFDLLRLIG